MIVRFAAACIAALSVSMFAAPASAQPAETEAAPETAAIGGGGRPVGPAWSRSPVIAEHGMAATAFTQFLAQHIFQSTIRVRKSTIRIRKSTNILYVSF